MICCMCVVSIGAATCGSSSCRTSSCMVSLIYATHCLATWLLSSCVTAACIDLQETQLRRSAQLQNCPGCCLSMVSGSCLHLTMVACHACMRCGGRMLHDNTAACAQNRGSQLVSGNSAVSWDRNRARLLCTFNPPVNQRQCWQQRQLLQHMLRGV